MKSFKEFLSEKVTTSGRVPEFQDPIESDIQDFKLEKRTVRKRLPQSSTGIYTPKGSPEKVSNPEVEARARRFAQSFGVPTGADPKTGAPTYKPLQSLTRLPGSSTGRPPSPEDYAKVDVGDLELKRQARTTTGSTGVARATPEGVRNFVINRETRGVSRRSVPETEYRSAEQTAQTISQNPSSPEYKKVESQINQEVGGRRAKPSSVTKPPAPPTPPTPSRSTTVIRSPEPGTTYVTNAPGGTISGKTPEEVVSKAETQVDKLKRIYNAPPAEKPKSTPKLKPQPAPTNINLGDTSLPKTFKSPKGPSVKVSTPKPEAPTSTASRVQDIVKSQRRSRQAAERLMSQKFKAGGKLLGRGLGAAGAAYDVYSGYQGEKAKGSGNTRALLKGLTQAAGATIGGIAGGAVVPVAGTIAGATAGSMAGGKLFDVAAGENARERAMRALQRRQSQAGEYFIGKDSTKVTQKGKAGFVSTGTGTDRKTSQLASTKVLKDPVTGKERVGYLAFKTSPAGQKQAVYKAGDTSQDLAKTSSNWLERLGRTYAPSLYSKSDAANERRQLSNARAQQNLMRTKLGMG